MGQGAVDKRRMLKQPKGRSMQRYRYVALCFMMPYLHAAET
jgi:hypothetical protein